MRVFIVIIISLATQYTSQAFVRWDLLWVFKIGEWEAIERLGLLIFIIVYLVISLLFYFWHKDMTE